MARRYRLIASPDLLQVDFDLLVDNNINHTRYSVDGQWAIIEYKPDVDIDPSIEIWDNDQACAYLEENFDAWNIDSLTDDTDYSYTPVPGAGDAATV